MSFTFEILQDPAELDSFVSGHVQNSLFQCSEWASVKDNWSHRFTCVRENGNIVATALILIRRMPLHKTLYYIPRGPVMDYTNHELVTFFLNQIRKLAKADHAIAVRFDPAVISRRYAYKDRSETPARENEEVISFLNSIGASHRGYTTMIVESTQPRFNAEMLITEDFESRLEHKTMKCIRTSERKGVKVSEGRDQLHAFAEAMHYTEVRKQIALRNEAYFGKMLDVYGDHGICMVARLNLTEQMAAIDERLAEMKKELEEGNPAKKRKAELQRLIEQDEKELGQLKSDYEKEGRDEVITCGILACYNRNLMELFYMGNNPSYMRLYSSYLLYKKCLDRCLELGIERCSFGGIEGTLDDGLTLFKSNWLMDVVEYIGEFNIVIDPVMYTAFDKAYPAVLQAAAKLKGRA